MFSDGIIPLIESGVITNQHKTKHKGYVVTGFMMGSSNLYAYVNDNPLIRVLDIMYVNDTAVIRQLPKVTAINSAIEVDLTGQVLPIFLVKVFKIGQEPSFKLLIHPSERN
jgi:acyl-CoA hydrolase